MVRRSRSSVQLLADSGIDVALSAPRLLADGFRPYERYEATLPGPDGTPVTQTRDVVRGGRVVGVLAIDLARNELVLIRQFRLAAHLSTGKGELIEIVAGRVEPNEDVVEAARRECLEEIGVAPTKLAEVLTFFPTPGLTDELATIFVGVVDASVVPDRAGAAHESEDIRPLRIDIDHALRALAQGTISNGLLIIALQWLALNRARIDAVLRASSHAK